MSRLSVVLAFISTLTVGGVYCYPVAAADAPAPTPGVTPVTTDNLDPATFVQWIDGSEKPVPIGNLGSFLPQSVIWTGNDADNFPPAIAYGNTPGMVWGESKTPGPRHLRIGFKAPILAGSVLVMGGSVPSVLKPEAKYPGDLNDESQWITAQRIKIRSVTTDETGASEALWTLPATVSTRALRLSHDGQTTDSTYRVNLEGALVLSDRLANIAPQAEVSARMNAKEVGALIDEGEDRWYNLPDDKGDNVIKPVSEDPEWVTLTWAQPRTLRGLMAVRAGFGAAEVQGYVGPEDKDPAGAPDSDWKTVKTVPQLSNLYAWNSVDVIDFGGTVTARAIRLRMTGAMDEKQMDLRFPGQTRGGRRVWLDELMALQPLKDAELKTAIAAPAPVKEEDHAPIAINFEAPDDGNVTLVIEDAAGKRVRNLIEDTPFSKGQHTVYWDGSDDLARDIDAAMHGLYNVPPQLVAPGAYSVRGLWHPKIKLSYEMTVYAPGNPGWPTVDGTGGWMTTHTPATSTCFIPAGALPGSAPNIILGCYIAEGGSALSSLTLNGDKLGGRGWVGGNWTGAQYLAHDNGPEAIPGTQVYVGATIQRDTPAGAQQLGEIRLTGLTAGGDKPVLAPTYTFDYPKVADGGVNMGGLAVYNGLLVFSQTSLNLLVFVDVKGGKVIGTAPMPTPRGLAFDSKGRLLVLSESKLLRFTLGASPIPLATGETVVANLDEPTGITVDAKDVIYISIRGTHNQVVAYSPAGELVRTFGKAGKSQSGFYDPNRLSEPKGIAVDSNERLWITEEDCQPKRVSVWNKDGTLWKAFYGAQMYGGGGALDSQDASRFSYMGMEFHMDWKKGEAPLTRIYYRLGDPVFSYASSFMAPELALHFNGKRYMTNAYNGAPTSGNSISFIFRDKGDVVVPAAAMGLTSGWPILSTDAFKALWPKDPEMFIWSDLNGDGQVQPNEVSYGDGWIDGIGVAPDGSFVAAYCGPYPAQSSVLGGHAVKYKPVKFTDKGVPIYDIKGEVLGDAHHPPWDGGGQALLGTDGWVAQTTAPPPYSEFGLGGSKGGVAMWSYPSLWPGLHPSHWSPVPDQRGELVGTTRVLGDMITPKGSDVGPMFVINSNEGSLHAFTQDGLYVAQLFADSRNGSARWGMPTAKQGMDVTDVNIGEENFFPTISQVSDGSIHIMTGGTPVFVKVDGLEKTQRIPASPITISADDLKLAQEFIARRELARQAKQGTGILEVGLRSQPPALDEGLTAWKGAAWATIDERGVGSNFDSNTKPYNVTGAMTVAGGQLVAVWKTGEPDLLKNSGEIPNAPFKTGGCLDLMIGTNPTADPQRPQPVEGDLRLLVTLVKGVTKAVLYRAVVPGTPDANKVPFSAPWHSISLDSVTDVSDKVQLTSDGKGNYEVSAPLDLLGLKAADGTQIKGDIGILRGDGVQTSQRVYWNNKATSIVSDVPSEAMLTPNLWGTLKFQKE